MQTLGMNQGEAKGSKPSPRDRHFDEEIYMLSYKGYVGSYVFDEKTALFLGRVSNIEFPITFQGKSLESTEQSFRDAINDYLDWCKKHGKFPERPLKEKTRS